MAKVNEDPKASTKDFGSQTTTDNWAELDTWKVEHLLHKTMQFRETGASNDVDVRVLGSLDGGSTYPVTVSAAQTISAGGSVDITVAEYYTDLKVEIQAAAAGSQGDVEGEAAGIAA